MPPRRAAFVADEDEVSKKCSKTPRQLVGGQLLSGRAQVWRLRLRLERRTEKAVTVMIASSVIRSVGAETRRVRVECGVVLLSVLFFAFAARLLQSPSLFAVFFPFFLRQPVALFVIFK